MSVWVINFQPTLHFKALFEQDKIWGRTYDELKEKPPDNLIIIFTALHCPSLHTSSFKLSSNLKFQGLQHICLILIFWHKVKMELQKLAEGSTKTADSDPSHF